MIRPPASRLPLRLVRPAAIAFTFILTISLAGDAIAQFDRKGFDDTGSGPVNMRRPSDRAFPRHPIFFPPDPPPLDRVINPSVPRGNGSTPPPSELASYINETFYPALGTRLYRDSLKGGLLHQLDAYRIARANLLDELRAELLRLHNAEPEERLAALARFAVRQKPRLAELEKAAEQLRRDLIVREHTWSAQREWRLSHAERRGFSPLEIAQVMRACAFYENGLLPAQRLLLREIAMELAMAVDDPQKATAAQPYVFFPPEPARVQFPEPMSADAAAKLARFQTRKSQLKKELYDAVHDNDGKPLGFLFGETLSALARKQATRLAELETLAEEVRRALPPMSAAPPPAERSALPRFLAEQVSAMLATYEALQEDASTRVDAIVARTKGMPLRIAYALEPTGLKFVVAPTRGSRRMPELRQRIETVRNEISAVADEYGYKLADLLNQRSAICDEIGELLGLTERRAIEAALQTEIRITAKRATEAAYAEYRIAVFEPGLSPEQRRLLFGAAIEKLGLPLPGGALQPTRRSNAW